MSTGAQFRKIALSLPRALEKPHFDRSGFRVNAPKGKMFATMRADETEANVFLSVEEQEILCSSEPNIFYPVPNKWGEKGATTIRLKLADKATLHSVLSMSWRRAAPPKILKEYEGER